VITVRVVGILTIVTGVEVSYSAFAYPNFEVLREISMIIFLVWGILLGSVMLKKTSTRGIKEKTDFYLKHIC
jgi:hypothetical protein